MIIGRFENLPNGRIGGELDALVVGLVPLIFEPNTKGADYAVMTETDCDVGAAWKKISKDGAKPYLSVRLDSPFLPTPLNAALFPGKEPGQHVLVWDRPERKTD